jgi:hypothetical protein
LARVDIDGASSNPAGLVYRTDRLVDQELSSGSSAILGKWGCPLFMTRFHFDKAIYCVGLLVVVDDRVMSAAQQNQIIVTVPLGGGLMWVVTGAARARRFDVADLSNESVTLDDFDRTPWKCAAVPGPSEQAFDRCIGRSC